jgi:hypothetical protein
MADILAGVREATVDTVEQDVIPEFGKCLADIRKGGPVALHVKAMGERIVGRVLEKLMGARGG